MAYAVLGVLVGLNIAATCVLGWCAYKLSQADKAFDMKAFADNQVMFSRIEALEKRKHLSSAPTDPEEEKFETPPRSMREVIRKAEAGEIPARRK